MPGQNHTHKYRRAIGRITNKNRNSRFIGYYKCVLPRCSHYAKAELILGKEAICNKCHEKFILPMAVEKLTNVPHCKTCTKKVNRVDRDKLVEDMINESDLQTS